MASFRSIASDITHALLISLDMAFLRSDDFGLFLTQACFVVEAHGCIADRTRNDERIAGR